MLFKQTSLEACFLWHDSYILTDRLNKTKLKNLIKSSEIKLNSKHGTEKWNLKSKEIEVWKTKVQNNERSVYKSSNSIFNNEFV